MSRIVRKETLHKYSKDIRVIRSEKSDFVILDRYSLCRALAVILDRKDSVETFVEL